MKILCLILFFAPCYLLGQQFYFSPYTQTFPTASTTAIDEIDRTITFEPETVTIATDTGEGKKLLFLK